MSLHKLLGFYPNNADIYRQAFTHCSISPDQFGANSNNERLEFLGDAVFDAVIADIVFRHFPKRREGFLTNTRSKIVQRESLNQIALELGLNHFVKSMSYATVHHKFMYGNALEALIGAIYIDKGFEHCHRFISAKIIEKYVMLDKLAGQEVNFKSRLLEWGQKEKIAITFDLVDYYTGEDGKPVFRTSVMLENHVIATATGNTKKESQQSASKTAMHKIKKDRKLQMLVDQRK